MNVDNNINEPDLPPEISSDPGGIGIYYFIFFFINTLLFYFK